VPHVAAAIWRCYTYLLVRYIIYDFLPSTVTLIVNRAYSAHRARESQTVARNEDIASN